MICVPFVYLLTPGDLLVRGVGVKGKYVMILALRPSQDRGMDRHVRKASRGLGGWGGGWGEAWRLRGGVEVGGRHGGCREAGGLRGEEEDFLRRYLSRVSKDE